MAEKPKRIQRKRSKGWTMPANTVYVGRPTKWGNPFIVHPNSEYYEIEDAVKCYRSWLIKELAYNSHFLEPLKGKNLACWCNTDSPCHADVLLELANQ